MPSSGLRPTSWRRDQTYGACGSRKRRVRNRDDSRSDDARSIAYSGFPLTAMGRPVWVALPCAAVSKRASNNGSVNARSGAAWSRVFQAGCK